MLHLLSQTFYIKFVQDWVLGFQTNRKTFILLLAPLMRTTGFLSLFVKKRINSLFAWLSSGFAATATRSAFRDASHPRISVSRARDLTRTHKDWPVRLPPVRDLAIVSAIVSRGVLALLTAEEFRFGFIACSCLDQPVIGLGVSALFTN